MVIKRKFLLIFVLLMVLTGAYFVIASIKVGQQQPQTQQQESAKIEKKLFGYSVKGKPIEGFEIGNGTSTLFLFSSIHGDEMGTTDLLNNLVKEIEANPNLPSKNKKLVIIPIANPDGYYDRTDKLNANGVNLNLNFDTPDWKEYGPEGTYAGPEPFSEVESRLIKEVVEQYKPDMMIAYHAFGALVSPEAQDASRALAKWYAEKTGYEYFDVDYWDYPGTATKWFVQNTSKPAITVELTKELQNDWDMNKGALFELVSTDLVF